MSKMTLPTRDHTRVKPQAMRWHALAILLLCVGLSMAVAGCGTDAGTEIARVAPEPTAADPLRIEPTQPAATPMDMRSPEQSTPRAEATEIAPAPADQERAGESERQGVSTEAMTADDFPVPPDRDLTLLARQMRGHRDGHDDGRSMEAQDLEVGDVREFWTLDYPRRTMVSNEFTLSAISDNAYWWTGGDIDVDPDALSRTVDEAEARVFPRVLSVFASGAEETRVHIVNGRIPGLGGYVSGNDQYPSSVAPYSNEAPAIYINTRAGTYGDERLLNILAHELQHSIHQVADESEATWLNEGLAELAVTEAGYRVGSIYQYLRRPNSSVVNWPSDLSQDVGLNYGAAALFAHYLREHYAPTGGLQDLLALREDGIRAVDEWLSGREARAQNGEPAGFHSVFADWVAANFLDAESGRHGYRNRDVEASITRRVDADGGELSTSLEQYSADYVHVRDVEGAVTVHFEGDATTTLLPTEVTGECWWSNRGDTISATLTRELNVPATAPDGSEPTLTYRFWHDIEEEWDYLYVSASMDGGETWDVLRATGTTDANPVGNSYGYGYTGDSDGWQEGVASLATYAGRDAMIRFHYVTDDAVNGPGMCVQNMQVSGDDDASDTDHWVADGFVRVNNLVRQDWIVWVLVDGSEPDATGMELTHDHGRDGLIGSLRVSGDSDERLVIAVAPTAPATMQPAAYRVWVDASQ